MCITPPLSENTSFSKTPTFRRSFLCLGSFAVGARAARLRRGCGPKRDFCHKMPDLRNKDSNSWRHLQLHPLAAGRLAADPATGLWVQLTSAAWADQASAGGREKNAVGGWRANAPPRAESEAPAERRRGCARLASGAESRASPLNSTNKIVPTNHQSLLRIRNSTDCGPFC